MHDNLNVSIKGHSSSGLIKKLTSAFKLQKGVLHQECESLGMDNVVYSDSLKEAGCDHVFYCIKLNALRLDVLLNYKRFIKSDMYDAYSNGYGLCAEFGSYILYFTFNNMSWVVYEADCYTGLGGFFVKENHDAKTGYVIEPFKNWFSSSFQLEESD